MSNVIGWLLPKGANVEPVEIIVGENHEEISKLIGCDLIDAVRVDVHSAQGDRQILVGYIDDNGIHNAEGFDDINFLASFLFKRTDPLFGNVVVVAGVSPDGVYDGDNHDLPQWVLRGAEGVVDQAANIYNTFVLSISALALATGDGLILAEELEQAVDTVDEDDGLGELLATSLRYMEMRAAQVRAGEEVVDFDEGLRRMLEQEGNQ
jgi:hypothetical protein